MTVGLSLASFLVLAIMLASVSADVDPEVCSTLGKMDGNTYFDFVADCGDGFYPMFTVFSAMSQPLLSLNVSSKSNKEIILPRGQKLFLGGDLVYPEPTLKIFEDRTERVLKSTLSRSNSSIFEEGAADMVDWMSLSRSNTILKDAFTRLAGTMQIAQLPPMQHFQDEGTEMEREKEAPVCHNSLETWVIPGNHDVLDGGYTFHIKVLESDYLGAYEIKQKTPYFVEPLVKNSSWIVIGIFDQMSAGTITDIDNTQKDAILNSKHLNGAPKNLVIIMHAPFWIDAYHNDPDPNDPVGHRLSKLYHVLMARGHKMRLFLAGDMHYYAHHTSVRNPGPFSPDHLIICGGGGAFTHSTAVTPGVPDHIPLGIYGDFNTTFLFPNKNESRDLINSVMQGKIMSMVLALAGVLGFYMHTYLDPYESTKLKVVKYTLLYLLVGFLLGMFHWDALFWFAVYAFVDFQFSMNMSSTYNVFIVETVHLALFSTVYLMIKYVLIKMIVKPFIVPLHWIADIVEFSTAHHIIYGIFAFIPVYLKILQYLLRCEKYFDDTDPFNSVKKKTDGKAKFDGFASLEEERKARVKSVKNFIFHWFAWFSVRIIATLVINFAFIGFCVTLHKYEITDMASIIASPQYKSFLRMSLSPDETLTIYPIGVVDPFPSGLNKSFTFAEDQFGYWYPKPHDSNQFRNTFKLLEPPIVFPVKR